MPTAESVAEKISALISRANAATGKNDTTMSGAVDTLIGGFGTDSDAVEPSGTIAISRNGNYDVSTYAHADVSVSGVVEAAAVSELHQWNKYTPPSGISQTEESDVTLSYESSLGTGNSFDTVHYSDSITVVDGALTLVDPTSVILNNSTKDQIIGKYIRTEYSGNFYRIPADAKMIYKSSTYYKSISADMAYLLSVADGGTHVGVAIAADANAYPQDGEQDGYRYVYVGAPGGTGSQLPVLNNPGSATDLAEGKELIGQDGQIVAGTVKAYSSQPFWGNLQPTADETDVQLGVSTSTPYLFRAGVAMKSPLSNFGDASPEDVEEGKTFTSAAGLKIPGTKKPGGQAIKSGTTTTNVIDTGLSDIALFILHNPAVSAAGLVDGIFSAETGKTEGTYCVSYQQYVKNFSTFSGTAGSAESGVFTWNGSGSQAMAAGSTYSWIAVGTP